MRTTIEERAKAFCENNICVDCGDRKNCDRGCVGCCIPTFSALEWLIQFGKSERAELTRWHNPFVKDMPKGNVLVKYIAVGCPNEPYYTVGRREPSGWWDCENELAISPRFEVIGWREIHE